MAVDACQPNRPRPRDRARFSHGENIVLFVLLVAVCYW
jgi:hypothetical protein